MKFSKNIIFYVSILFLFSLISCKTQKYLEISNGNKIAGTLRMSYEYGGFEKPVVHWDEAIKSATAKCQSWGYKGAELYDIGTSKCVEYSKGNCVRYRMIYNCECTGKRTEK